MDFLGHVKDIIASGKNSKETEEKMEEMEKEMEKINRNGIERFKTLQCKRWNFFFLEKRGQVMKKDIKIDIKLIVPVSEPVKKRKPEKEENFIKKYIIPILKSFLNIFL